MGERDRLVSPQTLEEWARVLGPSASVAVVPGANHSWRGHEEEAVRAVAAFLAQAL